MNEEVWTIGLGLKLLALIVACIAHVLSYFLAPIGNPPYTILNNIPAFLGGVAVMFFGVGFGLEFLAYFAYARKMALKMIPEYIDISRNVLILAIVISMIVSATILVFFGRLDPSMFMQLISMIFGALLGGLISYYASRAGKSS